MRFFAPAPVSVKETSDTLSAINDDLVGSELKSPTLFELADVRSAVSMNDVHRGADFFTTISAVSMLGVMADFIKGAAGDDDDKKNIYMKT